ncbi:hypothetical protein SMSP2_00186 [Limihaloglobus sulfuriphilus]|uniref:FG-GAP repeat protein n=1 Tax=Limihaloglobus sulfuriphilus TaxID=1851148 RepID=A0A1Q2MC86_9BACT|nr:LamG-like jellyroll fold domain-containing protein [Limihaloglobus sulfuriphilus]AQQ69852.1 hypothetical protein SMSP2_00186 [Limihaloglobus sulfuriphilus]
MRHLIFILLFTVPGVFASARGPELPFSGDANQEVTLRAVAGIKDYSDGIGNYIISAFDSENPNQLVFGLRMYDKKLEFVTIADIADDGKPVYRGVKSKSNVPLGRDVYLCAVRTHQRLTVYINGLAEGVRTITTETPAANRLRIGAECRSGNTARDIKGVIKQPRVFAKAFTPKEVAKDYASIFGNDIKPLIRDDGIYLPLKVSPRPAEFPDAPVRCKLNLEFIEAFLPEGTYIDPTCIDVFKWDSGSEKPASGKINFRSEYDYYPKHATVVWKRPRKCDGEYAIRFNGSDKDTAQKEIPFIAAGEPLSMGRTDIPAQGQGLAGYPVVLDYDGDGLNDLISAYVIPRRTLFYKNIGTKKKPVFKAPEIAFEGKSLLKFDMFGQDGQIYACSFKNDTLTMWKAVETHTDKTIEVQESCKVTGLPEGFDSFDIAYVDADSDGVKDLLVGGFLGTWWWDGSDPWNSGRGNPDIGYGRGYDEKNRWYGKPPVGVAYLAINKGTDTSPQFSAAKALKVNGERIEIPTSQFSVDLADFNGDGKLDFLLGSGVDETLIYYNTSNEKGGLELSMPVGAYRDSTVSKYSYFDQRFEVVDFDNDGEIEVIVGSNPGVTVLCEVEEGLLVEDSILEFEGANLWAESLVVPSIADLNRDGLWDVVLGDSSGFLSYFKNTGTTQQPVFAPREKLKAGGAVFRPIAGYSGSIQGPNEARWGYLAPNVCDFDGDGKPDVVLSDITGYNYWLRNISRDKGGYEFTSPQQLQVDTWPLKIRWRTRPAMWYFEQEDKMPPAIVTSDEYGFITMYERDFIEGPAGLKPGTRLKYTDGREIKIDGPSGYNGRSKFCAADYNGDGRLDLLIGQPRRGGLINAGRRYDLADADAAYVALLINAGSNRQPRFEPAKPLTLANGEILYFGNHSCSPAVMDVDGDGKLDVFIGTERGYVRCYNRSMFEDSSQLISVPEL